jgi:hypothetical protein
VDKVQNIRAFAHDVLVNVQNVQDADKTALLSIEERCDFAGRSVATAWQARA